MMSQTRMPTGSYKKMLIRLPPDILAFLQEEAAKQERSINGQLVHTLRQCLPKKDQARQRREATV